TQVWTSAPPLPTREKDPGTPVPGLFAFAELASGDPSSLRPRVPSSDLRTGVGARRMSLQPPTVDQAGRPLQQGFPGLTAAAIPFQHPQTMVLRHFPGIGGINLRSP